MKQFCFLFLFLISIQSYSQIVSGYVISDKGELLEGVNISLSGTYIGSTSDKMGKFSLTTEPNRFQELICSFIGYQSKKISLPMLKNGQTYELNIELSTIGIDIDNINIEDQLNRNNTFENIDSKNAKIIPSSNGGIESLIKTLPGVSSSSELSSQYNVRGGNFDENLVYVNGIEVYRPFLIRSGQQEGLSFINSDLVSSIEFSAGGYSAKYGDKMSSVLDVKYIKPTETKASTTFSLLNQNLHFQGISKSKKWSYILGARSKSNSYLLNSLETQGEYKPKFFDFQSYINYDINDIFSMSLLTNFSKNIYQHTPQTKKTRFGTISTPLELFIYFEGNEIDQYETTFGAYSLKSRPLENLNLNLNISAFQTYESETYDILAQYYLSQVDGDLGSETFGEATQNIGVGTHLDHARNYLNAKVYSMEHNGSFFLDNFNFKWGFKTQIEEIRDQINEWALIDSSGYSLPVAENQLGQSINEATNFELNSFLKTNIELNSMRYNGFAQIEHKIGRFNLNSGIRTSYWDLNEEHLFSPRTSISYTPLWDRDIIFRFSTGYYYQTPFYRELRNFDGEINRDIKSQQSIHYVLGTDYKFKIWQRPFRIVSELYYKNLINLIPYEIDNIRIRYYATNDAVGYSKGFDFRINGEFVKGIESWASLSLLKTEADILDDNFLNNEGNNITPGYYARPTDQRLNFSLFFQDYLPKNPNYKMHLNLVYGSRIPLTPPGSYKGQYDFSIPSYRRVDIGFSANIKKEGQNLKKYNPFKYSKSAWVSLEVFNLLDIDNTISFLWIRDTSGLLFGVPNRLTSRLINLKLHLDF
ncbi:MAG: TonB-dependent receptor [Flavobacteriales bacterium]